MNKSSSNWKMWTLCICLHMINCLKLIIIIYLQWIQFNEWKLQHEIYNILLFIMCNIYYYFVRPIPIIFVLNFCVSINQKSIQNQQLTYNPIQIHCIFILSFLLLQLKQFKYTFIYIILRTGITYIIYISKWRAFNNT